MHEMVNEVDTEEYLKQTCTQVGEHLYVKSGVGKNLEPYIPDKLSDDEKRSLQIVFSMGGSGTRVRHITEDKYSKHLIEVRGKPISAYVVDLWVLSGFRDLCILVDDTHRGKSVTDYYKDGEKIGAEIKYSIEHMKLASGGAIRLAIENRVMTKPFVNHYPDDIIINYPNFAEDFVKVFMAAMKAGYQCVVLCVPGKFYPYGVVIDDGNNVVDFVEKPFIEKDTNTGVFALSEDAFPLLRSLEPNKEIKIERTVLKKIAESGKMFKVILPTEYWIPVNDEPNLNKFVEIVASKKV